TQYNEHVVTGQTRRTREQVTNLLRGLELLPPGVVETPQWRPDKPAAGSVPMWAGVARKSR
ncbi:MAG: SAM-dependent methyltransferase, partial [Trebonia sp.]